MSLPGNLILETTNLSNSFQTVPPEGMMSVDRTFCSLLPSLSRIGHVDTYSCKAVWESEYLTFSAFFVGGSAYHHGRGEGSGYWGAVHRTYTLFLQYIFIEHLTWDRPSTSTRLVSLLLHISIFSVSSHLQRVCLFHWHFQRTRFKFY